MLQMLPPPILAAFKAHADLEAPKEACGLVIQLPGGDLAFRVCRNVAEDPLEAFEMKAEDWDDAEDEGLPMAILHSHPGAPAKASKMDRVSCAVHLIPWFILGQGDELVRVDPSEATTDDRQAVDFHKGEDDFDMPGALS